MTHVLQSLTVLLLLSACAPRTYTFPSPADVEVGESYVMREIAPSTYAIFVYHDPNDDVNWDAFYEAMTQVECPCSFLLGPEHAEGDFFVVKEFP